MFDALASPRFRRVLAFTLLFGSLLGWPLSAFWLAKDEPPFVLALSWLAITVTALDLIATTDVRVQHEEEEVPDGPRS